MNNSQTLKNKLATLKKVNSPLDETIYWNCIENVLNHPIKRFNMANALVKELEELSLGDIKAFHLKTSQLANDIKSSSLQTIAMQMNDDGCSDDSFDYFINWIISQGEEVYYKTKKYPEFLLKEYGIGGTYSFEQFGYIADEAFENKTGKDLLFYLS